MNFIEDSSSKKKQGTLKSLDTEIIFKPSKKSRQTEKTAVEKSQEKSFIQSSPREYSQE